MGCPWLPYCMLLLSPQINREHKFQPGPGPADTIQPPVRFLKISRKEDGMRWSRSRWYNQKTALPGRDFRVFIFMWHCTLPFIFLLFTDSLKLPIARVGQSDIMRYNAMKLGDDTNTPHSSQSSLAISIPRHITPGSKQTFTLGPELVCEEILFGKQEQFP